MATTCVAEDDAFALEAMRKEDSSWHHCQVSLSSNGVGLMVDFSSQKQEEIMLNKEEAFERVRIRSVPLQGADCSLIKEGEHVLATDHKSQYKSLFFDAEVEKVLRVRHSKRVYCRCTFVIKWLQQDLKEGTSNVPSSSILKLSPKAINIHPTIAKFLVSVKSFSFSGASTCTTQLEEIDCELDLTKLVEQQIKGIANLADHPSKKGTSEYILWGVKDDSTKPIQCKVTKSDARISPVEAIPGQNHLKRSTRSSSKMQVQIEVTDFPHPAPSILEEVSEIRSHLSPLASCAALASLVSKFPLKLDFSCNDKVEKKFTSIKRNLSMKGKLSSGLGDASLISPQRGALRNTNLAEPSSGSGILLEESKNESMTSKVCNSNASIKGLITGSNLNQPPNSTRITRSAGQKGAQISNDNFPKAPNAEGKKLRTSTTTQRLTHSVDFKEQADISMVLKRGLEGNYSANSSGSDSSEGSIAVVRSDVSDKESSVLTIKKPLKESNKKQRTCTVDTIRHTEGKVSGNGTSSHVQKRKSTSSRKQDLRSSPRLRFLPRTRSQNKC